MHCFTVYCSPVRELDAFCSTVCALGAMKLPLRSLNHTPAAVAPATCRLRVPRYIPDFREAFNHFCLHAGGWQQGVGQAQGVGLGCTRVGGSRGRTAGQGRAARSCGPLAAAPVREHRQRRADAQR